MRIGLQRQLLVRLRLTYSVKKRETFRLHVWRDDVAHFTIGCVSQLPSSRRGRESDWGTLLFVSHSAQLVLEEGWMAGKLPGPGSRQAHSPCEVFVERDRRTQLQIHSQIGQCEEMPSVHPFEGLAGCLAASGAPFRRHSNNTAPAAFSSLPLPLSPRNPP